MLQIKTISVLFDQFSQIITKLIKMVHPKVGKIEDQAIVHFRRIVYFRMVGGFSTATR